MKRSISVLLILCFTCVSGVNAQFGAASDSQGADSSGGVALPQGSATYKIAPLDVLRITLYVADEVQFQSELRVSQSGEISLPYLNNVKISGMSMEELRDHLYVPYNRDYYVNPHIDIVVLAYSERFVTIIGKVNRQGPIPFPTEQKMFLLEAIAKAGGWSNDRLADSRNVTITRTRESGEKYTIKVDARNITAQDHELFDGDLINIPERIW